MLDFRSDTVTKPTRPMIESMCEAEVGDGGYGEDTATNELEMRCAELFGTEDALFVSSGTLGNQIALRIHTVPGDEVIVDQAYHLNVYESTSCAQFAQVTLNAIETPDGVLRATDIDDAIDKKRRLDWCAHPSLLCLENTVSHYSGAALSPDQIADAADQARAKGMRVHLDGARLFNASVARNAEVKDYAASVDTISVCFTKGLGAPYGSILVGSAESILRARFYRKIFGGETRQGGFMAAAASYALDHNIERLADDHDVARILAHGLRRSGYDVVIPESNIVVVDTRSLAVGAAHLAARLLVAGLQSYVVSDHLLRLVTHMNVTAADAESAVAIFESLIQELGFSHLIPRLAKVAP